jgi:neutral ceramidase
MLTLVKRLALPLLALLLSVIPSVVRAQETNAARAPWKVGLAQTKITPTQPLLLAGYASRNKPYEKVVGDLYVKAMALEDAEGHRGVFVTCDLIGFSTDVVEPICERVGKQTGLKREQIVIAASHTHTGPQIRLKGPAKGEKGAGEALRNVEYTRQFQDKAVEIVVQALGRLEPARLSWGGGVIDFAMNRREFTPRGVILGVNPRGLTDRGVPVLRVDGPDGRPRAVLFGTAVHGTTLGPNCYDVCGDFPGFAQEYLQERYPKAQVMYMLGCAGDTNPYPRMTGDNAKDMEYARRHGKALADEVSRVLDTKLRPVGGPLRIAFDRVDLPLLGHRGRPDLEKLAADKKHPQSKDAAQLLAKVDRGEKLRTHYTCPVTVWQFGNDLTLVGLSGEIVVDYVQLLEKALGPNRLWVAAYCNDVFGYLPSARVLGEGGYETRGVYSGDVFHAAAEGVLVQKVIELARKVGRELGK